MSDASCPKGVYDMMAIYMFDLFGVFFFVYISNSCNHVETLMQRIMVARISHHHGLFF